MWKKKKLFLHFEREKRTENWLVGTNIHNFTDTVELSNVPIWSNSLCKLNSGRTETELDSENRIYSRSAILSFFNIFTVWMWIWETPLCVCKVYTVHKPENTETAELKYWTTKIQRTLNHSNTICVWISWTRLRSPHSCCWMNEAILGFYWEDTHTLHTKQKKERMNSSMNWRELFATHSVGEAMT